MLKTIHKIITNKKYNSCFLILSALILTAIHCALSDYQGNASINETNIPVWLPVTEAYSFVLTALDAVLEIASAIYKKLK